jgi:2-furoyl-CoA dehydrogenase 2Fe-2S iron sulfur subunit
MAFTIKINGADHSVDVDGDTPLLWVLRDVLGMTGTKFGCGMALCGACTVQIDGVAQRACMTLAVQAEGREIETVEGLNRGQDGLTDLQQAFRRNHALQCGFCTAGILMSCTDYLQRKPDPTEAEVREMLSGHLCRCTGYTNIVKAVLETAAERLGRPHAAALAPDTAGHAGTGAAEQAKLVNA